MESERVSGIVIGAAHKVLYELKPGLDEKLYERALTIELQKCQLTIRSQQEFPVYYEEHHIGTLIPDMIVGDIIVDPKVVSAFTETHVAKMLGYLNITGLEVALLLNFKYSRLGIKRVSNSGGG